MYFLNETRRSLCRNGSREAAAAAHRQQKALRCSNSNCSRMVARKAQASSGVHGARMVAAAAAVIACVVLQAVVRRNVGVVPRSAFVIG